MSAGAMKVGYKECNTGHMAINSIVRDDRSHCFQRGFCFQGCRTGAKWSTLYTELPRAQATGHVELRTQAQVVRIEHDARGRAKEVVYYDSDGKLQRQKARIVAVAGNSIETPRLLLNSHSGRFADGLANSSGQVGRNYMRHTTGSVYAVFDEKVDMFKGTTMAGIIEDEAVFDPKRGFAGGYHMETISLGLPFYAAFLDPGAWGPKFTQAMDQYAYTAGMWIVGEDMPRATNRITLNSDVKDQYGQPVANVHFDDHPNDEAMREHAFTQGSAVYAAAGAKTVYRVPPYPSTHNLGTARMSSRPEDGVCNSYGQTHDISNLFVSDGSQFTTGAAENPTLTIVTLAIRQADYITGQMSKRSI
jgi:choline dehydrogenase-like flavoprotein